jgi:predicted nuclease of predicted toxin-antitoxin system
MKILLDECLPLDFRHSFPTHDAHTTQWAGLKSKKNGELLLAAEVAGYDVLVTVDQGIPHQQYPAGRKLSIILLRSRTNQLGDLLPLVDAIMQALATIQPGQTVEIPLSATGSPAVRPSSM